MLELVRELVAGGRLGRPVQISSWNYKSWLNLPRSPDEIEKIMADGKVK